MPPGRSLALLPLAVAACAASSLPAAARAGPHLQAVDASLGYDLFRAPSSAKITFPFALGDPSLRSGYVTLSAGALFGDSTLIHGARLETHWPGTLRFDDGTGRDRVLDRGESSLFDLDLSYSLDWWAIHWSSVRLGVGGLATAAYHRSLLAYQAGGSTRAWDLALGLGLSLPVEWVFLPGWRARAELRNRFFLPWLSQGAMSRLGRSWDYRLMAWESQLGLEVSHALDERWELGLAYAREEQVGLGNPPSTPLAFADGNEYPRVVRIEASHKLLVRVRLQLPGGGP